MRDYRLKQWKGGVTTGGKNVLRGVVTEGKNDRGNRDRGKNVWTPTAAIPVLLLSA